MNKKRVIEVRSAAVKNDDEPFMCTIMPTAEKMVCEGRKYGGVRHIFSLFEFARRHSKYGWLN